MNLDHGTMRDKAYACVHDCNISMMRDEAYAYACMIASGWTELREPKRSGVELTNNQAGVKTEPRQLFLKRMKGRSVLGGTPA